MARRHETVSFLSDYGTVDEFAGVVKSVVRSIAPHALVIDVTHEVPPHDVRSGSLALARAVQYLAPGVVLAVVDPGVGTTRRAVAVEVGEEGEGVFVGPDNGLLAGAVALTGGATRAVELTNAKYHLEAPGPTFAGRDIFGPVAAHLCNGVDLVEFGDEIDPLGLLPGILPLSRDEDGGVAAEVLWIDRYGNVQLNVDPADIDAWGDRVVVSWGSERRTATRARTYGDIGPGVVALVVDSYGLVSIAVDRGSAAEQLKLHPAMAVRLEPPS
ncbi:MAG TPA: SAM-dependent chlorinase/fluorinase [Acidimicrobiales bacterium]|nr:SAM-dependent chlorinase/fluorinase [Acidimicrobiales bacterium]